MKINQYEFLRNGKPFEPTREEIIQFAEHELAKKDKQLEIYKNLERYDVGELLNENIKLRTKINTIHKEVCDKIKQKLKMNKYNCCENTAFGVHYDYLKEILDQIEKGE